MLTHRDVLSSCLLSWLGRVLQPVRDVHSKSDRIFVHNEWLY